MRRKVYNTLKSDLIFLKSLLNLNFLYELSQNQLMKKMVKLSGIYEC